METCLGWFFCSVSHFLGNLSKTDDRTQVKVILVHLCHMCDISLVLIRTQMFLVSLVLTWPSQKWTGAERWQPWELFCKNCQFTKTHVTSFLLFSYGKYPSCHPLSLTGKNIIPTGEQQLSGTVRNDWSSIPTQIFYISWVMILQ